jgi:hypothetical protein
METKNVVSIAEMARMVGLSRARFYQLIGTTFPFPIYDVATRRPFYNENLQMICLDVRRRNCGIDGKPVLFYCGRGGSTSAPKKKTKAPKINPHADLLEGLKALGLPATVEQVQAAVKFLYPNGLIEINPGEVLRAVFLQIKRQNRADNVGR